MNPSQHKKKLQNDELRNKSDYISLIMNIHYASRYASHKPNI